MELRIMVILGVIIIILLSLITMLLVLLSIRKLVKMSLDSADLTLEALTKLQESVHGIDQDITSNFNIDNGKANIAESKLISVSDAIKDIAQAITNNHSKVMNILSIGKKPNKARRRTNTTEVKKYPPLDPR